MPQTLSINSLSLSEIQINKLSRYVFPKEDFGPTSDGQIEIPTIQSLRYVTNLSCHKVSPELKSIYDEMCGRDILFPEISESGMQATKYDIRAQCTLYKKSRDKNEYVKSLTRSLPKNKAGQVKSALSGQHVTINNTGNNLGNACHWKNYGLFVEKKIWSNACHVFLEMEILKIFYLENIY